MKTTEELLARLVQMDQERRLVTMLTDVLMLGMRIPVGIQLVLILGDGSARDNRDAVYCWVKAQLDEFRALPPNQIKGILASRLYRQLLDAQAEMLVQ